AFDASPSTHIYPLSLHDALPISVRRGAKAPEAAGVIHSDFERGFIRAETIVYDDYIALGGEQGAKDAGRMRAEGKEYLVADGDRSEEHTSELQSRENLVCRLLLE